MVKVPSFSALEKGYENMYNSMKFTRSSAINAAAKKIIANKDKYLDVQSKTGIPWYFIGALHMRESSNDFRGVLHNGEKIIGTGRKTTLVPKGRGPFADWNSAAIDALKLQGFDKVSDWSVAKMGYYGEKFNGLGYYARGVNSPYLWAGTNHQQPGKYVKDGIWSPTATDQQLGIMPVIYRVRELENITSPGISVGDKFTKEERDNNGKEVKEKEGLLIRILRFLFSKN